MMMVDGDALRRAAPWEVMISADCVPSHAWADWLTARLEPKGVDVYRVSNADEALRIVRRGQLKLAVLDAMAPRYDGLNLLRRIRSFDIELPCLIVANTMDPRRLELALELKAYSVVSTPIDETIMRDLIAAVFRRFYESELLL